MLRNCVKLLRRTTQPKFHVPARNWAQVTMCITIPPRCKMTFGEGIMHCIFMVTVWMTPFWYCMTQIKVWKRKYLQGA